jgi:hypothetical protein
MGIVIDSMEALLATYLVAICMQLGFGYLISLLGRRVLMNGDRMRSTYFISTALAWIVSAAVGAYVAFSMPPFGLVGSWVFTLIGALLLMGVVFRNQRDLPHQQTTTINILFSVCILIGCLGGDLLRLKALPQ